MSNVYLLSFSAVGMLAHMGSNRSHNTRKSLIASVMEVFFKFLRAARRGDHLSQGDGPPREVGRHHFLNHILG